MRVAIVHNFHGSATPSGEDAVVEAEAAALARSGVTLEMIGIHNDDYGSGLSARARAAVTVASGFGASPEQRIAAFRPDVVHVHSLFPFFGSRWLARAEAPVVATLHSYRAVCANGYLYRDGEVCSLCPDGAPLSAVRFGCYQGSRFASLPHYAAHHRGLRNDPLIANARLLLVLSDRARLVFSRCGVPEEKMRDDWHFVPDDLDLGTPGEVRDSWVFVGRLSEEKGIDRLVREWPPGEHLRVVGEGPLRPALERAAAGRSIEFLGKLPRSGAMAEVASAIGVVFTSRWYETFGLVYIEALARGVPILAFPPSVVADAVARDGTGIVGEWGALRAAIDRAKSRFPSLRTRCRQMFEERYTEASFVERRLHLYGEVTA